MLVVVCKMMIFIYIKFMDVVIDLWSYVFFYIFVVGIRYLF